MITMADRLSLRQWASQSGGDAWACPRCGCADWRTINSYVCDDGTRHRRQFCRKCKQVRMTYESTTPPATNSKTAE